jgi:hypothetical protein
MVPTQVWLPTVQASLSMPEAARDAQRAYAAWSGEGIVWLLPEVTEPGRWARDVSYRKLPGGGELTLPAEHWERLGIFHIDADGWAYGLGVDGCFPGRRVDGLLLAWLNAVKTGGVSADKCPEWVTIERPRITERGILYEHAPVRIQPVSVLPVVGSGETLQPQPLTSKGQERREPAKGTGATDHVIWCVWPPEGCSYAPISPEGESAARFGPLERVEEEAGPVAVSQRDPTMRALHLRLHWRPPLAGLLPFGGGLDVLWAHTRMVAIAARSANDPVGALQEAREAAGPYLGVGVSNHELSWFMPTLTAIPHTVDEETLRKRAQGRPSDGLIWALAFDLAFDLARERFRLEAHDYVQAVRSGEWKRKMRAPIPIRRAYGAVGLFWALLLDRLEASVPFQKCERCHYLLEGKRRGKKTKRLCGAHDNKVCYNRQKAEQMRRSRARR